MATHADKSPVTRETSAYFRDRSKLRPIIATLRGPNLIMRMKGTREARQEVLDLAWCFRKAVEIRINAERAERRASRRRK